MNQYSGTLICLHCLYGAANVSALLRNLNWILCESRTYCNIGLKSHEFHLEVLTYLSKPQIIELLSVVLVPCPLQCESIFWESLGTKNWSLCGASRCPLLTFFLTAIWHDMLPTSPSLYLLHIHLWITFCIRVLTGLWVDMRGNGTVSWKGLIGCRCYISRQFFDF